MPASLYTLDSLHDEHEPLVTPLTPTYGSAPTNPTRRSTGKLLWNATLKMASIFLISSLVLGVTLWLALPTLEETDRPFLRVPKSFSQLKDLNGLLKKYRDIYPYRIIICYIVTYLFLQAFSLPGSMYLSILGGAVWGVPRALPLACTCVATGATLCYLISAALGPALLTFPKWKARLDQYAAKIKANKENIVPFLIILRISPLPPHWVLNVVCPHVGIGIIPFWISTWFGILGVSVIHTTIGSGLDDMTSAEDFHLISWRNFFGLSAVVVGVLIPVGLRWWLSKKTVTDSEIVENIEVDGLVAPADDEDYSSDDDSDVILETGPSIVPK